MKKQRLSRDILFLSILTVITVFTWIFLDIYRTFTKIDKPKIPPDQLETLNPDLEIEIIQDLSGKESFSPEEFSLPETTTTATEAGSP